MNKKEFLSKHRLIDFWQRCLRHFRDPDYINIVTAINRDPNLLYFVENGNEYPQYNFYDIFMDYPSKGFFALLNQTLDALKYAERFHMTPVITWSDRCLYKEEKPVNDSENPFCYFFEPVTEFERTDLNHAARVLCYRDYQRALGKNRPFGVVARTIVDNDCYDSYIEESAAVYRKYIRLKAPVMETVTKSAELIGMSGSILGVHVRATDFQKGYINHAVAVEKNEYIEAARKAFDNVSFDKLFLATDDASVVEDFRKVFGKRVIFCNDVFRSEDGNPIHFSSATRDNHKYKLGVEVIRDMMLLSKCNGLIGGYSNVCITAQIVKKSTNSNYYYLNIIDKGFNNNGITTYRDQFGKKNSTL